MKTAFIVSLLILVCLFAKSQTMPEAFIGMLPDPPGSVCSEGKDSGESGFKQLVSEVSSKLEAEISRRRIETKGKMKANQGKMMQNAMAKTGVSPELAQQMMALEQQSKGATGDQAKAYKAQKKALADQMMQQSMNISMDEVNNLKKMDKAGKTAWAEAYSTEKKAEVMADPEAYKQKNAAAMKDYKLAQKQKELADSLGAQATKYMKQIQELDNDQGALALETQIKELEAKLNEEYQKENRPNDDAIKSLSNSIRNAQISYCNMQSPKYLAILARYKTFTQASLTPYYRLEKLTNQVNAAQTGVQIDTEPGLMGLEAIGSYLNRLSDVYRYNHINIQAKYIGSE